MADLNIFLYGFLDKDKAPLFLPPPRTRGISLAGSDREDNFGYSVPHEERE